MNVLVIGGGGREHALCASLAASAGIGRIYCAPGNGGMIGVATRVPLDGSGHEEVERFCRGEAIDLVVVGPEMPLVGGLVDSLRQAGIRVFGPTAAAAQLEGSKNFAKEVCAEAGAPTAPWRCWQDGDQAKNDLAGRDYPLVVKADGLAAGKGVVVADDQATAESAIDAVFSGAFGERRVVLEDFMAGEEASLFVLSDGTRAVPLGTARDYKRVGEGDVGANTGGMGACSPSPALDEAAVGRVMAEIVNPVLSVMRTRGTPFAGILYVGLMLTPSGPKVVEFNVRFGDPECQVVLSRLESDLLALLTAAADGCLKEEPVRWRPGCAVTVVMAARGYPGDYVRNSVIGGLEAAEKVEGVMIFHAGTERDASERVVSSGGRVLNVTAVGDDVAQARARAYEAVALIDWPEGFCRRDIAAGLSGK